MRVHENPIRQGVPYLFITQILQNCTRAGKIPLVRDFKLENSRLNVSAEGESALKKKRLVLA